MKRVKLFLMLMLLTVMSTNAWSAVVSGTTYYFSQTSTPAGWSANYYDTKSDYVVLCKPNYICSEAFFQQSLTSIVVKMRRYDGTNDQGKLTLTWVDSSTGTETALGTLTPTSTSLSNYTLSSFTNTPTANTTGYVKFTCVSGNSSGKGGGIAEIKINYTVCSQKIGVYRDAITNGTATVDKSEACPGEVVTVTVIPNSNYGVNLSESYIMYYRASDGNAQYDYFTSFTHVGANKYSFVMPEVDIASYEDWYLDVEVYLHIVMYSLPNRTVTYHVPVGCVESPADGTSTTAKVFPDATPLVPGYKFEGWVSSAIPGTTSVKPSIYASGEAIPSNGTYYAVYSNVSSVFKLVNSIVPGKNYMISSAYNSSSGRVMSNELNNAKTGLLYTEWTISDYSTNPHMTCTNYSCIWKVEATATSGVYAIYNEELKKYVQFNGTNNQITLADDASAATAKWTFATGSGNVCKLYNNYSSTNYYLCQTSTSPYGGRSTYSNMYLFEQETVSISYTTAPEGCATTYTVTYEGGSGVTGSVTDTNSPYDPGYTPITVKPNGFTKTDYNFTGWKANVDIVNASTSATITAGTLIAAGTTFTMPSSNVVFTAQWTPKTYLYGSSCEPLENITVTYNDAGTETEVEYGVGTIVPVDSRTGSSGCADWVFVGWSASSVANNSTSYTPVHNFTAVADEDVTLYAVYDSVGTDWISALTISELKSGAEYVIVRPATNHYVLTDTVASTNYLKASQLSTKCSSFKDGSDDRYKLEVTPRVGMKWELVQDGLYYALYNKTDKKWLKVNNSVTPCNLVLTTTKEDKFTMANGGNDCEISIASYNATGKYVYKYSEAYFKGWDSEQFDYFLTNVQKFTSNPPCSPRSVEFDGNGGTVIAYGGSPTGATLTITEAARDEGITTPTATFADCNGKSWSFVGWSEDEIDLTRVPVLTTDLLNGGGGNKHHDITKDGEKYYAVYTNVGAAEAKKGVIVFDHTDFPGSYNTSTATRTVTIGGNDYDFEYIYLNNASNLGIQFKEGLGVLQNTTSLGRINYVTFIGMFDGDDKLSRLKLYVGNSPDACNVELTASMFQSTGDSLTFYPSANYPYLKIYSESQYAAAEKIKIGFGMGTKVWATTPDCSTITLTGDIKVTSTNGRGIMAVTPLTVNARQFSDGDHIVITSNSSDVYFSANRTPNFAMAAANQPKNSVTLTANASGEIVDGVVYVHYKPSSDGTGAASNVVISASCTENPEVSGELTINVRNMPAKFAIAAKVGGSWYALPANLSGATNPAAIAIDVDESTMTAKAPSTCAYSIWPVKTVNPASSDYDRYATNANFGGNAYGERVRFGAVNNSSKALWANNSATENTLNNDLTLDGIGAGGNTASANASYEWKIVTTITDGKWNYTLQTDQSPNNTRYLRYWLAADGGPKWGTYASGEQTLYFIPITEVTPAEMSIMEWGTNKVAISYNNRANCTAMTAKIGTGSPADVYASINSIGGDIYEITGVGDLQSNPAKTLIFELTESGSAKQFIVQIPFIVTSSDGVTEASLRSSVGDDAAKITDVVIRDGGKLTTGTASGAFKDLYIYPSGKAEISRAISLKNVYMRGGFSWLGGAYAHPQLNVTAGVSISGIGATGNGVFYDLYLNSSMYYMTSLPKTVAVSAITNEENDTEDWSAWVKEYSGQGRTQSPKSSGWLWLTTDNMVRGKGYEIAIAPRKSRPYGILRFPLLKSTTWSDEGTPFEMDVKGWGCDSKTVSDNNKGWNFIGNPFMTAFNNTAVLGSTMQTKTLVKHMEGGNWNGKWDWSESTVKYLTIPRFTEYEYDDVRALNTKLEAFFPFFIQVTGDGSISMAAANKTIKLPARSAEETIREVYVDFALTNVNGLTDVAGLTISDQYSETFDMDDKEKTIQNGNATMKVYTIVGEYRTAFNSLPEAAAALPIPVGYIAPQAGSYHFSLVDGADYSEIEHVWLTDYQENSTVDLRNGTTYQFETAAGEFKERFAINVILKKISDISTGVDEAEQEFEKPQKFIYRDKMYILRGGQIYDATGKQVKGGLK